MDAFVSLIGQGYNLVSDLKRQGGQLVYTLAIKDWSCAPGAMCDYVGRDRVSCILSVAIVFR